MTPVTTAASSRTQQDFFQPADGSRALRVRHAGTVGWKHRHGIAPCNLRSAQHPELDCTGRLGRKPARALSIFGQFIVADTGIAVRGKVTLSAFVIPIQLGRLFPLRTLVCSIAERQRAGEPAAANVLRFAADGHRIGLVAKALDESRHDRSFRGCPPELTQYMTNGAHKGLSVPRCPVTPIPTGTSNTRSDRSSPDPSARG